MKTEKPNLPTVKKTVPHTKDHGNVVYDGQSHFCPKLECEINKTRTLQPIFDAIDRGEI